MATSVPNTNTFSLIDVTTVVGGSSLSTAFTNADPGGFDPAYSGSKDRLSNFRNYQNVYNMFAGVNTSGIPIVITNTGQVSTVPGAPAFSFISGHYTKSLPYFDFDTNNNIMMYRAGTGSIYADIIYYSAQSVSRSFVSLGGQNNHMPTYINNGISGYWVFTGQSGGQARYCTADSSPTSWYNVAGGTFPTSGVLRKWSLGNGAYYYTTSNGEIGKVSGSLTGSATELQDSNDKDFECIGATGGKIIAMEDGQETRYASYTDDTSWADLYPITSGALVHKMVKYSSSHSLVLNEDSDLFYMYHVSSTPVGVEITPPASNLIVDVFVKPGTTVIYILTLYNGTTNYIYKKDSIYDGTWEQVCQLSSRSVTLFKLTE